MNYLTNIIINYFVLSSVTGFDYQFNDHNNTALRIEEFIQNLNQKIPSELDELSYDELKRDNERHAESKGGALQRILSSVSFECKDRFEGYYADIEFGCHIFHYCKQNGLRFTFICATNSIFNQKEMTCDHNVTHPNTLCQDSHHFYYLNAILYAQKLRANNQTNIGINDNVDIESTTITSLSISGQPIGSADKLTDASNLTVLSIRPFRGYNDFNYKNIVRNKTNNDIFNTSPTSSPIEQNQLDLDNNLLKNNDNDKQWISFNRIEYNTNSDNNLHNIINKTKQIVATNKTSNDSQNAVKNSVDWDDIETGIKIKDMSNNNNNYELKPNLNEMFNSLNGLNYANTGHIPLPPIPPMPILKSEPLVMLRPTYIPPTLPIATLYKQTEYMFGKPHVVHKGIYMNPNFGPVLNAHTLDSPPPPPPIGLISTLSEPMVYPKVLPKNAKLISNFQTAFTKFPFNDIFGFKIQNQLNPKRKGNDYTDKSSHNLFRNSRHKSNLNSYLNNNNNNKILENYPQLRPQLPINPDFYHFYNKFDYPIRNGINFPTFVSPIERSFETNETNQDFQDFVIHSESLVNPKPKSKLKPKIRAKYSVRMDDSIDSLNIMKPSLFDTLDTENRKKWFETYAKIKKRYTDKEKSHKNPKIDHNLSHNRREDNLNTSSNAMKTHVSNAIILLRL